MPNKPDLNLLIQEASKKLGMNPNDLKKQVESGKLDQLMKNLPPQQAQGFQQILNNPDVAKKMMQSPQVQQMMKQFFQKDK